MKFRSIFLSVLLSMPVTAAAQNINLLPEGQTLVTLSVTERVKVQQDLLIASLRIESDDRNAQVLQNRINTTMEQGLALARAVTEIKVATGYYSVYQFSNQPQGGRPDNFWRASQSITLEGMDAQKLLDLAGELQGMGFVMNQLSYQLSSAKADEVRETLLESAVARATQNARRAGQALGKSTVDIAVLDVDTSLNYESPVMMRAQSADKAEMSAPVAEAGESEVTLTVRVQAVAR